MRIFVHDYGLTIGGIVLALSLVRRLVVPRATATEIVNDHYEGRV